MVCSYQPEWAKERPWLQSVKTDKYQAWCAFCLKQFSIKEGMTAVRKHERGKKHTEIVDNRDKNLNSVPPQRSIESSFINAESLSLKRRKVKDQALEAEAMLVACLAKHCIPETMFDCFNVLLPEMFSDSAIAKEMALGRTKAGYLLTEGLGPHYRQQVIDCMKKHPFSVNFDESTVNKSQQLNVNVSIRNTEDRIVKAHFTTLEVLEGSTGKEIAGMIIKSLEDENIPHTNLVSDQTDGCAAMLGIL